MKKIFVLLFSLIILSGCVDNTPPAAKNLKARVITYDSCEYIIMTYHESFSYSGYGFMAHKGNCKYCKIRREKEYKNLINKLNGNN